VTAGQSPGHHEPVLLQEVIEALAPGPGMVFVDGTVGSAGHLSAVLSRISPGGIAVGIDRDEQSLRQAGVTVACTGVQGVVVHLVHTAFTELERVVERVGLKGADMILLDLGLSSDQLDDPERGFSFMHDGPLDMRADRRGALTAADVVNGYSPEELHRVLRDYGEERHARRIVEAIIQRRKRGRIAGTLEFAGVVAQAVPGRRGRIHPATRTFQALRIEVNGEMGQLRAVLPQAARVLRPGGRLAVIAYHGLEERVVKEGLKPYTHGRTGAWRLSRVGGVVRPTDAERRRNPRSRSAKLRMFMKVEIERNQEG